MGHKPCHRSRAQRTHRVRLWAHEAEVVECISRRRINEKFLPGHLIPEAVVASSDLERVVEGARSS